MCILMHLYTHIHIHTNPSFYTHTILTHNIYKHLPSHALTSTHTHLLAHTIQMEIKYNHLPTYKHSSTNIHYKDTSNTITPTLDSLGILKLIPLISCLNVQLRYTSRECFIFLMSWVKRCALERKAVYCHHGLCQHWFRKCLDTGRRQAISWTSADLWYLRMERKHSCKIFIICSTFSLEKINVKKSSAYFYFNYLFSRPQWVIIL